MASAKEIPPGGEGSINVSFKTKGRVGEQKKTIKVETNDPDNPILNLSIKANVTVNFAFEPNRANFGFINPGEIKEQVLNGIGEKLAEAKVISYELRDPSHAEYYDISFTENGSGDQRKIKAVIKNTDKMPRSRFNDNLLVTTNLEEEKINIYLTGEKLGLIHVMQRSVSLRRNSETAPYTGYTTLRPTTDKKFKVISAKASDDRVKVKIDEPDEQGVIKIECEITDKIGDERLRGTLKIKTDIPSESDIEVNLFTLNSSRFKSSRTKPMKPAKGMEKKIH